MASTTGATIQRQRITIQGIVQGVGFRPFVYGLALRYNLVGFVLNDSAGVTIEVESNPQALDSFHRALQAELPPLARIDTLVAEPVLPKNDTSFVIAHSVGGKERRALISPDTATCDDCLRELFDPANRRYNYPFINCTNCGPRFTIVQDVPYDRDKTTMRIFPMCPACQAEYDNPLNRRFHAQPNACPVCGPHVKFINWAKENPSITAPPSRRGGGGAGLGGDPRGRPPDPNADPITTTAQLLANGAILAIKGLGGYHLACDALNEEAVQRLRNHKHREAKPFALMALDIETARQLCNITNTEATLLQSRRRPIVLLTQKQASALPINPMHQERNLSLDERSNVPSIYGRGDPCGRPALPPGRPTLPCEDTTPTQRSVVAPSVAPGYDTLGIMLPYTPLHAVLLQAFAQAIGPSQPAVLVMTSGNLSEEPIAYQDEDARARLSTIADGMLTHNRDIHMRCDDSVIRVAAGEEQFLRRSRAYTPEPIPLSFELPVPILACGGHLKNTFCLGKVRQAFLSHHIGDLENPETLLAFRAGIEHFQRLFDIHPQAVVYDLHPEYIATKYALDTDFPHKIGVQHHHAHIAGVLAEHGLSGPVIGVAADGTGYGTDGAVWGCEIMAADLQGFERLAHLRYIPLPGGEMAVRQPWRVAAAYLAQAYGDAFLALDIPFVRNLDRSKWRSLSQMIARNINSPQTSSMGRLFDAVAALIGLRGHVIYEGQAAIELEILAQAWECEHQERRTSDEQTHIYPFAIEQKAQSRLLDVAPMFQSIVNDLQQGVPTSCIAARFHHTITELLATVCDTVRAQNGLNIVALSGGVFQNKLLLQQLITRLEGKAFQVVVNRRVPPNDGGLSLGQLAIAAAQLAQL